MLFSRDVNRLLWAVALLAIVFFGYQARDHMDFVLASVGKLEVRDAPEDDAVYLSWRGNIEAPLAVRLSEAFNRYQGERRRFVLTISSPGGSLGHGAEVIRLLRNIGETHSLDTVVEARGICASMCVPVYLQGRHRTAAAGAKFMFHEVSFREFFSDEEDGVTAAAKDSATDRLFARYFVPAGVPQSWISKVRAGMTGGRDIWKSAQQLVDEQAGIVQQTF
jgi:ATP-dependent protease ClpP protease subunit